MASRHVIIIGSLIVVALFFLFGYMSGALGYSAIPKAKAYSEKAASLYEQSNTLYDQSKKESCKAYGIIVAACYSGDAEACPHMTGLKDSFRNNYDQEPFDVCGV